MSYETTLREEADRQFRNSPEYKENWDVSPSLRASLQRGAEHLKAVSGIKIDSRLVVSSSTIALFHHLLSYGLFGYLPGHPPAEQAEEQLRSHITLATSIVGTGYPENMVVANKIVDLARGRFALDEQRGSITPPALSNLAGVTERHVQNLISKSAPFVITQTGAIEVASALAWLRDRTGFRPSIWRTASIPLDPADTISVPVAADGSMFSPALRRRTGFTVGRKGEETKIAGFEDALTALRGMTPPRWRRPNEQGNWGTVAGVRWEAVNRRELNELQQ